MKLVSGEDGPVGWFKGMRRSEKAEVVENA